MSNVTPARSRGSTRFSLIPASVILDPAFRSLTASELKVLIVLALHADKDRQCFPSLVRIAELTGLPERTVCRALGSLEVKRVVLREKRGGRGRATRYSLPNTVTPDTVTENTVSGDSDLPDTVPGVRRNTDVQVPETLTPTSDQHTSNRPVEQTSTASLSAPSARRTTRKRVPSGKGNPASRIRLERDAAIARWQSRLYLDEPLFVNAEGKPNGACGAAIWADCWWLKQGTRPTITNWGLIQKLGATLIDEAGGMEDGLRYRETVDWAMDLVHAPHEFLRQRVETWMFRGPADCQLQYVLSQRVLEVVKSKLREVTVVQ